MPLCLELKSGTITPEPFYDVWTAIAALCLSAKLTEIFLAPNSKG